MVNYCVQGSSADATKEAIARFAGVPDFATRGWRVVLQVHDEIVLSVPAHDLKRAQDTLRDAMASLEFDVPMLSEGEWSAENWGKMMPYDKKGELLYVAPTKPKARKAVA